MSEPQPAQGHVAFLDILGFSHLVTRPNFIDEKWNPLRTIAENQIKGATSHLDLTIASDSLILTTGPGINDLKVLISVVAAITYSSLVDLALPIRGGLALGAYTRTEADEYGVLVAGPAVVAAYNLEQSQNWVGVTLAPGVIQTHNQLGYLLNIKNLHHEALAKHYTERYDNLWHFLALRYDKIPLHDRGTYSSQLDGFVVVPHLTSLTPIVGSPHTKFQTELAIYTGKLDILQVVAPDVRAQAKYRNAICFINDVQDRLVEFYKSPGGKFLFPR